MIMQMYIIISVAFMLSISVRIKVNDFNKAFKKAADNFEKIRSDNFEWYFVTGKWFGPVWTVCLSYMDFSQKKVDQTRYFLTVTQYKIWMIRHYGKVE